MQRRETEQRSELKGKAWGTSGGWRFQILSKISQKLVFPKGEAVTVEMTMICLPKKGDRRG